MTRDLWTIEAATARLQYHQRMLSAMKAWRRAALTILTTME